MYFLKVRVLSTDEYRKIEYQSTEVPSTLAPSLKWKEISFPLQISIAQFCS